MREEKKKERNHLSFLRKGGEKRKKKERVFRLFFQNEGEKKGGGLVAE